MGISFRSERDGFVFDFEHDGTNDIIALIGHGYHVEAFGKCMYYGYEFAGDADSNVRSAFIKKLKFTPSIQNEPDLARFIQKAVNDLNDKIDLYDYDMVIMPQSSSGLNLYVLRYLYRFAQPSLYYMELVKSIPESISFDMDGYQKQYLDDVLENGRPRYTPAQKEDVRKSISEMMDLIHKKDYFTIAGDVRKSKLRPYITRFLRFGTPEDEKLCSEIRNQNVLIADDITTSGSTLNEILRTVRILNPDNKITIFSLIGRKDLMSDSF